MFRELTFRLFPRRICCLKLMEGAKKISTIKEGDQNLNMVALKPPSARAASFVAHFAERFNKEYKHKILWIDSDEQLTQLEGKDTFICALGINSAEIGDKLVQNFPNLKWIHNVWTGCENLCKSPELLKRQKEIIVTNNRGSSGQGLAEFVIGAALHFFKQFDHFQHMKNKGEWQSEYLPLKNLAGKTIAIIGLGSNGSTLAKIAKQGFGMKVLGIKRDVSNLKENAQGNLDEVSSLNDLKRVCGNADIVVNYLPITPKTEKIFDIDVFKAMKPSAIFINVGRGNSVVEPDLIQALKEGIISAAALDVFSTEPLPPSSPFYVDPEIKKKVILTCHAADQTIEYMGSVLAMTNKNFTRFANGEPLENVVDINERY